METLKILFISPLFKRGTAPDDETCKHLCDGDQRDLDSNGVTRKMFNRLVISKHPNYFFFFLFFLQPTPFSYTDKKRTQMNNLCT